MNEADPSLDARLAGIRNRTHEELARLEEAAQQALRELSLSIRRAIESTGRSLCSRCNATGAIERLDSGYMRRFGMREWDGCPHCGGKGDVRGRGYN